MASGSQNGTLVLGNATPVNLSATGTNTITFNGTGATVNYGYGGAQTVYVTTYENLTLSGSGGKTFAVTTVTGNLTLGGTATVTTGANLTVGGNLNIGDGTSFAVPAYSITVAGTTIVGGGTSGTLTISSATGTKTFTGLVTINVGATWNNTANEAITFQGGITNNGTFTAGTGVQTFSTNAQSLTGTLSIPSVTVTGVTLTNNGTLTITTALAGTGGLTNAGTLNINFTGAAGITTLTATANGNTVNYGYAGTQTVFSTNYYNLTLSSSGVKTLQTGTTTIGGNLALNGTATTTTVVAITVGSLVVGDGTGLTVAGFNLTVNGTTIVGGGTSGTLTISSATGTKTFTGLVTINVGATWNNTANEAITFQGGITNNGTFTAGTGVQTFSTNAQSLTGTLSIPSVTVTGVTLTNNGTLTVTTALAGTGGLTNAGTLNINFTGAAGITTFTATANGNTVSYGYAGTQTLRGVTYYNLTLAGSGAKTMTGVSTINGNFTLAGSATAAAAAGLTIGGTVTLGTGTTFTGGAYNHNVAGDWTNNGGTFTATGSTVNLDGTSPQTIDGTNGSGFNNLTINNASGISLGAAVSVAGTLTLTSGVLTTSSTSLLTITNTAVGSITGASVTSYVNGPLAMTLLANVAADGTTYSFPVGETGNFRPLDLVNIRTGATAPVVRVTISGTGASTGDGTTITSIAPRNWYVQVTTGNFTSATIRLTESGLIPTNVIGQSAAQSGNYVSIGGTSISTSVTSVQSVSSFPVYFAIGISSIKPLYSYQSGNWDSTTTWTTDPSGTLWINPRIPGTMDNVVILNARTISISVNAKKVVSLTIISGGILDIKSTTGHNFGTVAGQGKIMLSSNSFPGGTFTSFVASNGGTVEYYNLNNVPISTTQFTYNNLIISDSSGTISAYLNNGSNPTTYTINGNFSLKNYSSGTNTFYFGNPTASDNLINMTIYGNFSVDAGCNIRVNNFATSHAIPNLSDEGATAYLVHSLSVYGSFTNNGSVRFTGLPSPVNTAYYTLATTATGGINYGDVQVFFYGAANNTIVCNGTTDFFRLIVAKGSDETYILEVSSSNTNNFALYGPNFQGNNAFNGGTINGYGYGAYYKALFIHYGTLKLDANISIPSLTEGGQDFNVIPTAGLWINGATVSTTVTGLNGTGYQAATLYGSLRISAGQFSTGDAAGIVLGTLGTPMILIEGTGVLDVSQAWTASGGSNLMSYIQTGGTANIRLQGENHAGPMLGLSSPNASFVMSGGTLNFNYNAFIDATTDYAIMDVESQTGYYQVTGGTVNLNLPSSATAYTANSTVPFYNLNILNKTGTGTTTIQWNTPGSSLNVLNNLTIGSNAVLNLNTSSISLSVGNSFTISSGGTYTPGAADTTIFNGSGYQAFTNAGTITGGLASLTVTNSSSTTIISNNVTVNGTLTIGQNAVLNDSGKTVSVAGNISNSGKHISNSTAGGIVLTGTAAQTISGSGTGIFNNLTLNKTAGSVTVSANMTVTGNLRLAGTTTGVWNILNIGSYNLSLGTNAVVYSDASTGTAFTNNRMIQTNGQGSDGGVSKTLSNTSAFSFPFGFYNASNTTYYYMPQSIQFSSAPTTYGTVTTRPVNARDPFAQSTNSLACYWKTTSTGFTGIPLGSVISIYYYNDYFVSGTEANYIPAVFGNSIWHYINNTSLINTTTDLVSYNAADSAGGDYTAGQIAAFNGTIYTYYSIANGPWNAISTWSLTRGGPPASAIPVAGNIVVVCSPYIVTTTAAAASGSLTIETGATLDLGNVNGHSFGSIPACGGTLRIASSGYFPTGDWGNFLGTSGGTVGYYQTAALTLNLPTTYTLPNGSSANITSYCNLITLPYSGSNIILPNTNLTIYKNFTVGYSPGGGTTNCTTQLNPGATATVLEVHGITTVNQYGILQYMNNVAQIVIADSDVNIANGGTLKVRYGGNSVANTLTVYGNIINNGRFDLDSNTTTNTYYSSLQFTGSFGKSFSGTAARTHLYNIIMNKGATLDSIVNVSVDTTGFLMGSGGLSLQNGTFRLTSAVTMALSSGGFTIPVTGGLSANGGTFNIVTGTTSADLTLKGRLEVLSGTVNVGPAISSASTISSSIVYSAAGSPTISISGGTLNVFSQVRRDTANNSGSLSYTQTGGAVTVGARNPYLRRAAFEDLNTGSSFVMSNGTLIIASGNVNATSPYDLDLEPDISKVTGGTIQFGLSGVTTSQTSFRFETSIPLWNVMLDATTNAAAIQEVYNSTISGNLTIGGGSSYYNANGLDLEIGGNLINNNTDASIGPNVGGFQSQSLTQTTSFLGSTDQTITGTSSNRTNFANLEIATSSGDTVFLSNGTSSVVVNGDLTLTSGTLNDGGNSIYLLNDVDNNAAHVSPNANSGGMIFSGASNQGMTGSGSGIFGNIEINNGGNGVNMTDNSTINGRIKFTKGYLVY